MAVTVLQGSVAVLAPISALQISRGEAFNLLYAMQSKFLPWIFDENDDAEQYVTLICICRLAIINLCCDNSLYQFGDADVSTGFTISRCRIMYIS